MKHLRQTNSLTSRCVRSELSSRLVFWPLLKGAFLRNTFQLWCLLYLYLLQRIQKSWQRENSPKHFCTYFYTSTLLYFNEYKWRQRENITIINDFILMFTYPRVWWQFRWGVVARPAVTWICCRLTALTVKIWLFTERRFVVKCMTIP